MCTVFYMIKLVKIHISSHRCCNCNNTLVVTVGKGLTEVGGFDFETGVSCD